MSEGLVASGIDSLPRRKAVNVFDMAELSIMRADYTTRTLQDLKTKLRSNSLIELSACAGKFKTFEGILRRSILYTKDKPSRS